MSGDVAGLACFSPERFWCVKAIYRTKGEPNVWRYLLEERKDLKTPATELSIECAKRKTPCFETVYFEPVRDGMGICTALMQGGDYSHGSRIHVDTPRMLNEFKFVSEGEVND